MVSHPSRSKQPLHPMVQRVVDRIRSRQRLVGYQLRRLHVMAVGDVFEAHIGWRNPSAQIESVDATEHGVQVSMWSAPDDDIVALDDWSDDRMRQLCRAVGARYFDRHDGIDTDHLAWIAVMPPLNV